MAISDRGPDPARQPLSPDRLPSTTDSGSLVSVRAEWISFYDDHYHRVVRFMMHTGAPLADAQDAVQEAFTESWKLMNGDPARWQAVNGKSAWIRTVALRRHQRPTGTRQRPLTDGTGKVPDQPISGPDHAELTVQAQVVLQALHALDEEARTVMAFHLDGFSAVETAGALGITEQRVRDLKKRARVALKKQLATAAVAERRQP